jgi:chitinase
MNPCCSHYGWCGVAAYYCSTTGPAPCQSGFGGCHTKQAFRCDLTCGSALKRTIGYYQGLNVYSPSRVCNQITSSDIKLGSYTHLNWAFAEIDPTNFTIVAANLPDERLYHLFTSLSATSKVQTRISIGGLDYSTANPPGWSDMVSTNANRQTFINSPVAFITRYGFQGVNMDWEYPFDDKRGGRANEMKNLVQAVSRHESKPKLRHQIRHQCYTSFRSLLPAAFRCNRLTAQRRLPWLHVI